MNAERTVIMKKYEQKIVLAIDAVVSEKGFTNVVPLSDKLIEQDGTNITDTILEKLNKN